MLWVSTSLTSKSDTEDSVVFKEYQPHTLCSVCCWENPSSADYSSVPSWARSRWWHTAEISAWYLSKELNMFCGCQCASTICSNFLNDNVPLPTHKFHSHDNGFLPGILLCFRSIFEEQLHRCCCPALLLGGTCCNQRKASKQKCTFVPISGVVTTVFLSPSHFPLLTYNWTDRPKLAMLFLQAFAEMC